MAEPVEMGTTRSRRRRSTGNCQRGISGVLIEQVVTTRAELDPSQAERIWQEPQWIQPRQLGKAEQVLTCNWRKLNIAHWYYHTWDYHLKASGALDLGNPRGLVLSFFSPTVKGDPHDDRTHSMYLQKFPQRPSPGRCTFICALSPTRCTGSHLGDVPLKLDVKTHRYVPQRNGSLGEEENLNHS